MDRMRRKPLSSKSASGLSHLNSTNGLRLIRAGEWKLDLEAVSNARMQSVAKDPIGPKPRVVIRIKRIHPAQFHLPTAIAIAPDQAAYSNGIFENSVGFVGVDTTDSYVGNQFK